jgi:hypothetical protein
MRTFFTVVAFGISIAATASGVDAAPIARLQLQSQPGEYIGQGGTFDITYQNPPDTISPSIRSRLPNDQPTHLRWILDSPGSGNQFSIVQFSTDELGLPIQAGTYLNAQRASFANPGHPGLDITFQNRGSNTLTGSFTIEYVTFDATLSTIESFKATFEQHSEGLPPALFGTFTYAVPEPAAVTLIMSSVLAAVVIRRSRQPNPH